jgi:hypothetical protein
MNVHLGVQLIRREAMRTTTHTGLAFLALAFAMGACDGEPPTSLDPAELALAAARGRDDGTVSVPITLRLAMHWIVPGASAADCPELIDPETGELFTAVGTGTGHGQHLGRIRVTQADHPTVNLCSILQDPPVPPGAPDLARTGRFEFVGADGSALVGRYDFLFAPPEVGGFFSMTVEGGTGRFQGAGGQLEHNFEKSGDVVCVDPLCLHGATLDPQVLEGTLTLPKP